MKLRGIIRGILCLAVAAACVSPKLGFAAEGATPKILFLTHSQGFKHGSLGLAEKTVVAMAKDSKAYEAVVLEGYKQDRDKIDLSMISADYLKQFAAVMFFTTGELPLNDSQKKALLDYVKGGGGFIGTHSATDTFYTWPEYGRLIGAYFAGHHPNDEVLILKVEDQNHPATKMLGPSWPIADEFYQFIMKEDPKKPYIFSRKNVHVLISVDTEHSNLAPQQMKKDGYYPVSWCQNYGKGRQFYTSLGHRDDIWASATYQAHLLGGIKWVLGLEPGDATPSEK